MPKYLLAKPIVICIGQYNYLFLRKAIGAIFIIGGQLAIKYWYRLADLSSLANGSRHAGYAPLFVSQ